MRFALLGDHPDGLDMARALVETGRHTLTTYSGPGLGAEILKRWGLASARQGDIEEVLADPAVELVIVAGTPAQRPAQLRRALQSERHVLCVHPADDSPDIAYEAAMIQGDTGKLLLPLMPESLHPAFRRLTDVARLTPSPLHPLPSSCTPSLLECQRWSTEEVLLDSESAAHKAGLPGWDVLRLLGGEISEVLALCSAKDLTGGEPVLVSGQFIQGGLFQITMLPKQTDSRLRLVVAGAAGRAELLFSHGWPGPARLCFIDADGQERVEEWPTLDPWPALVESFEAAVSDLATRSKGKAAHAMTTDTLVIGRLGWLDAIRALELDDAARRSISRRRASTLDYQEMTEEAGFKGTMTLVGCSILWISLMLLILSAWVPWLGWFIAPVFAVFLILQLLRWVMPSKVEPDQESEKGPQ